MEASKLRRFINWLTDTGCILFLFLALLRILPTHWLPPKEHLRWVVMGVGLSYYLVAEVVFRQTIGRLITRTLVVTKEDEKPTAGQLAVRAFCRFLPLEPFSVLFSRRARGWHDMISGTKIIFLNY